MVSPTSSRVVDRSMYVALYVSPHRIYKEAQGTSTKHNKSEHIGTPNLKADVYIRRTRMPGNLCSTFRSDNCTCL